MLVDELEVEERADRRLTVAAATSS